MNLKIAPSILSADKTNLQKEVNDIEPYSDLIHVDIMDGKFVPPTTFDYKQIKAIKSKLQKDVHLMVEHPMKDNYIDNYIEAGASSITIHEEAKDDVNKCISYLHSKSIKVGLSINPPTDVNKLIPFLDKIDLVLIMSVNSGYAGQKFIPGVLEKVKLLRKLKPNLDIEIDGGINKDTIKKSYQAGVNIFVAGSAIFDKKDRKKAIEELRQELK
jgi:ribulose-phosphate 3-epimerase